MALTQPTNLFPSSFRGSGGDVIDASVANTFSLQLNGTSACVAYSLSIMQNDTNSTVVYTVAKTTLSTPIYPRNYKNEPQRLEVVIPSSSGMVNGYANGYKWNVKLYWDNSNYIECADTFFLAQATPTLTVVSPPVTVTAKSTTLSATYTQANGVPIEWYRWTLLDSNGNSIEDSGEIYSSDIRFAIDGLISGATYTYTLTGQTQSGVSIATVTGTFDVLYDSPDVSGITKFECNMKTGSIKVSFPLLKVIPGTPSDESDYSYTQDLPIDGEYDLSLAKTGMISYTTVDSEAMALDEDSTHIWSGRPLQDGLLYAFTTSDGITGGLLLSEEGTKLSYVYGAGQPYPMEDDDALMDSDGYELLDADGYELYQGVDYIERITPIVRSDFSIRWIIAAMHKESAIIQVWVMSQVSYPDTDLYPSLRQFPSSGSGWANDGRYTT